MSSKEYLAYVKDLAEREGLHVQEMNGRYHKLWAQPYGVSLRPVYEVSWWELDRRIQVESDGKILEENP